MTFQELFDMPVLEFKKLIIRMFESYGYLVADVSGDRILVAPYHLRIHKTNETALVKLKSWSYLHPVELADVIALSYNAENLGFDLSYFITLGTFNETARMHYKDFNAVLIDGNDLEGMLAAKQLIDKTRIKKRS